MALRWCNIPGRGLNSRTSSRNSTLGRLINLCYACMDICTLEHFDTNDNMICYLTDPANQYSRNPWRCHDTDLEA